MKAEKKHEIRGREWEAEREKRHAPEADTQKGAVELLRSNESLRHDLQELRAENADLARRLAVARIGSQTDRDSRRAALNLMEDAVHARRAEEGENIERRRAEEELRQTDRRKDEFLATLAHELRSPLAPLRNSLNVLRLDGVNSGPAGRVIAIMQRQVDQLVRLVDDLLEVARISRDRIEFRLERVDLVSVVRTAVETSTPLIEAAGHELKISLPTEPLLLDADPVRLAQVFCNLLNNAAKYTERGGQIWLTATRHESHVNVSVLDNGMGMPREMLPKIFDLFTQIDRTYNRAQGGLGIGLTLVRKLLELHGGTIEAISDGIGCGSELVVSLPLAADHRHPEKHCSADDQFVVSGQRILVVDDNHDSAESLAMLLKFIGADVYTVNDGRAALDALRAFRPSAVFLDIGMPHMDGMEVARRARELPEGRDVTLIALTGWGQEEDRRRSKQAGFDHHLVKPVDIAALQALLNSIPPPQRPAVEAD
jgi:signal transduction histidine kinase/ActR/RegA family two-component response regulator